MNVEYFANQVQTEAFSTQVLNGSYAIVYEYTNRLFLFIFILKLNDNEHSKQEVF
jgi:hypothetical protein